MTKKYNVGGVSRYIKFLLSLAAMEGLLIMCSHPEHPPNALPKSQSSRCLPTSTAPPLPLVEQRWNEECGWEWHVPTLYKPTSKSLCLPWTVIADDWWAHHAGWRAGSQNQSHYCLQALSPQRAKFMRNLHNWQHPNDTRVCDQVFTKVMWQSGWGADMAHVLDGLLHTVATQKPFQVYNEVPWHYAATKWQGGRGRVVCHSADLECYFLPLSSCRPNSDRLLAQDFWHTVNNHSRQPSLSKRQHRWLLDYATRPQTWLRRDIQDLIQTMPPLTTPCTIFHVRRADVVLHGNQSRRYHAIREYVDAVIQDNQGSPISGSLFLLTDDNNAIQEALREYPQYDWVYIRRPRFRGSEGGWENQLPSYNPQFEMVVLLTIFDLARQCTTLVHSQSNLAQYLAGILLDQAGTKEPPPRLINIDRGKKGTEVYSANHSIGLIVPGSA